MRASVFTEYGPPEVLHVAEVSDPVPDDREVLVKVHATSVNFGDTLVRNFKAVSPRQFHMPLLFWLIGRIQFGFRKPRTTVLGSEFAGDVVAVGREVTRFKVGEHVFGYSGARMGAYAEYLRMPERGVMATMPTNITYEQAGSVPYGAIMAWGALRKMRLKPGQSVLVIGASGGIGPVIVQLAISHFAANVTGVCGPSSVEFVRSLGADNVIDYTVRDFLDGDATYDVIVDILGKSSFANCGRALKPGGRLVYVSFKMRQVGQMLATAVVGPKKVICLLVNEKAADLDDIRAFIETGKLRPFVDKTFALEQAADAHRYAESTARKGPVVITMG